MVMISWSTILLVLPSGEWLCKPADVWSEQNVYRQLNDQTNWFIWSRAFAISLQCNKTVSQNAGLSHTFFHFLGCIRCMRCRLLLKMITLSLYLSRGVIRCRIRQITLVFCCLLSLARLLSWSLWCWALYYRRVRQIRYKLAQLTPGRSII